MDPLSITTSCIALITAVAQVGGAISRFVVSCRDARQDLAAVSAELAELSMTLNMLKSDADGSGSGPVRLPKELCRRICDLIRNCDGVIAELAALLERYGGGGRSGVGGMSSAARWSLSGKKEAAKIRASLEAHKGALALVVEATTLHMVTAAAADVGRIADESSVIKEYTMKIVEQLARQDEILEEIAWIRAVISQRPAGDRDAASSSSVMDGYLDRLSDYAGSVCGDSVMDEVAEEMRRGLLSGGGTDGTGATLLGLAPIKPPATFFDGQPDPMTIVIGNTHRLVEPTKTKPENRHLWSFFVKTSGEEIIEEVRIDLHRTFSPSRLLLKRPPYKVTKIGWGYFVIDVRIRLKPGYLWCADDTRSLHLEWKLDFQGVGNSISHEYPVRTKYMD